MSGFLVLLSLMLSFKTYAQENFWAILAQVTFQTVSVASGYEIERPQFSEQLRSFEGKKIKLKGYLIPLSEMSDKPAMMLSSLPFNVCYFCGGAGPETVIEIQASRTMKFTTKPVILEGYLDLNDSNPDHHIYILKSATLVQQ